MGVGRSRTQSGAAARFSSAGSRERTAIPATAAIASSTNHQPPMPAGPFAEANWPPARGCEPRRVAVLGAGVAPLVGAGSWSVVEPGLGGTVAAPVRGTFGDEPPPSPPREPTSVPPPPDD